MSPQTTIIYDGRQINAGNGTVQFVVNMQKNMFKQGFMKYILFNNKTSSALPTSKLKVIINANTDNNIVSNKPYTVLGLKTFTFEFEVTAMDVGAKRYVGMSLYCHNNNIFIMFNQF